MKDFIKPPEPKDTACAVRMDRFIEAMNHFIAKKMIDGKRTIHINDALDLDNKISEIPALTDHELEKVTQKAKKDGYSLSRYKDNYQTYSYKISTIID